MSSYEPYPAESAAQQAAQQPAPRGPRPQSVQYAVYGIWAKIALNVLGTVIGLVTVNSVVDDAIANAGGGSGTATVPSEDTVRTIVVVSIVGAVVISVGLMSLLAIFVQKGANWARITYTVLVSLGLLSGMIGLAAGSVSGTDATTPALNVVLSIVGLLLTVVVLVMLWRKESNVWFAGR